MVVPVTSSLAVVPGAHVPNYCATKAALHSFIVSMQIQFKDSGIQFLEILPPYVHLSIMSNCSLMERLNLNRLTESELHDSKCCMFSSGSFTHPLQAKGLPMRYPSFGCPSISLFRRPWQD